MEKELKIAELASIWGVSVPTTWNRVRKEGLSTIKKIDENRKEIAYVIIPDNILNKYIITVNNNDNNRYYEEMLTDNNINNNVNNDVNNHVESNNNSISAQEMFDKLTALNNHYNERFEKVNEELIHYKSQYLLLEDKTLREGYYVQEINGLKTDFKNLNNDNKNLLKWLLIVIIMFVVTLMSLIGVIFYHRALNASKPATPEVNNVQQEVKQPLQTPKKPAPKKSTYTKKTS